MRPEERIAALGFSEADDGDPLRALRRRRVARQARPRALPDRLARDAARPPAGRAAEAAVAEPGYERWDGNGALGYLTLAAICRRRSSRTRPRTPASSSPRTASRPAHLGWYVRRLAEGGLVAALTATSPARLAHPDGGEPLAGTNPLAIGIPSSDGKPLVADVSMGAVTHGDVLRGAARPEELVPFGGEQAHKAFALALGLQVLVDVVPRRATRGRPARSRAGARRVRG